MLARRFRSQLNVARADLSASERRVDELDGELRLLNTRLNLLNQLVIDNQDAFRALVVSLQSRSADADGHGVHGRPWRHH